MTNTLIQFALAAGSITGLWIVSKNPIAGWRWCAIMEIPWTVWAVSVDAWGFMVLCWLYGGIYTRNLWKARNHAALVPQKG